MEGQMYIRIKKCGIRTNVEFSRDGKRYFTPNTFFDMKSDDYEIAINTGVIRDFDRIDSFVINTSCEIEDVK